MVRSAVTGVGRRLISHSADHLSLGTESKMEIAWYNRYSNTDLLTYFENGGEQEYIDAMFILLIWQNFGVLLNPTMLTSVRG